MKTVARHLSFKSPVLLAGLVAATAAYADPRPLLSTHVPQTVAAHGATLVGAPPPDQRLLLAVALPLRDEAGLDAFLRDIYDAASPSYRHYLSVAEFTDRFGPSQSDYDTATAFFAQNGMTIVARSANRYLIDIEGPVSAIGALFHVKLQTFRHPTEARTFIAPDREPTLDLAVPIKHVTGLDDFTLPTPRLVRPNAAHPNTGGTGSGPGGNFLGSDIRTAYYGGTALTGAGQTLGLMELAGYNIADVNTYFQKFGPKLTVPVVGISTDGASLKCTGNCDDGEQALDIEYAIAMAPGLAQMQVYVGRNAEDVLNRMASDNTSKQLSTSWGWNENFATDDALFKEMAAQGQSFLTASGDYSSLQASGPWPEEDANLTAVGGTDLTTKSAGGPWKKETGWAHSAGGPSVDKTIKIERYQLPFVTAANGGSKTLRNVPDIAGDSDTDNYICADGTCVGGFGGTSFASPILAGFVALANQQAAAAGLPPVGFLNPALYKLAGRNNASKLFHDETAGKSGLYSCTPSFDLVTGVGSPAGQKLIDSLAGK